MSDTALGAAQHELFSWYPQFRLVCPPRGTTAVRAWIGRIQPFPDETEYVGVMAHFEQEGFVSVRVGGALAHSRLCHIPHEFRVPFTAIIKSSFEILLLEFSGFRHPRVYGVCPEISRRRFPTHPHLRDDQQIVFNGKPLQALCTYLSSDGVVGRDEMRLVQVLDYAATYLAKHLLWIATNGIESYSIRENRFTRRPNQGGLSCGDHLGVHDGTSALIARYYRTDAHTETTQEQVSRLLSAGSWNFSSAWWIGKSAPHFVEQLLKEVSPKDECHCGSGYPYQDCCRARDLRNAS